MHYNVFLDTPVHIMTTCLLLGVYQLSPYVSSFQENLCLLKMKNQSLFLSLGEHSNGGTGDCFCLVGLEGIMCSSEHGVALRVPMQAPQALISRFVPLVLHYHYTRKQ